MILISGGSSEHAAQSREGRQRSTDNLSHREWSGKGSFDQNRTFGDDFDSVDSTPLTWQWGKGRCVWTGLLSQSVGWEVWCPEVMDVSFSKHSGLPAQGFIEWMLVPNSDYTLNAIGGQGCKGLGLGPRRWDRADRSLFFILSLHKI